MVDPSKAIIPGVTVVATNERTNISTETITNDSGLYVFPNLLPGSYTVTAELVGFKRSLTSGLVLQIGDARTLDFVLELGDLSETVTVTGESTDVNVTTTKVGAVVQDRQALDLPLNGRDAMMLFYLQAGTNPLDRMGGQQQVGVVDGLAPHTSAIKVEGVLASNPGYDYSPAHPSTPVPQEAVGEYRVTTSGELSDAGKGSGAQVKVLIKSGTNQFHGSVFEFNRNTAYNANNFFNNRTNTPRPVLRRNQFGFAIGGPIIKDHTFFFTTAEWQRQNRDVVQNRLVYTDSLRNGIFRFYKKGSNSASLVDASGKPKVPAEDIGTIDLLTVDPTRQGLDQVFVGKVLFPQQPLPNNYDLGDGFNTAGFNYISPRPENYYIWLLKIDHQITQNHQLAGSFSIQNLTEPRPELVHLKSIENFEERRRGGSLRLVSAFTPHITNELSAGANLRLALRPMTNPQQESPDGNFQLIGLGTGTGDTGSNGNINWERSDQSNPAVNMGFQDTVTWVKSNHTLSLGGEFWRQTLNRKIGIGEWPIIRTSNSGNPATIPALAGLSSTDRSRAQQLTNDLTGAIGNIEQRFYLNSLGGYVPYENDYEQLRKNEWSIFVQDIWKFRPNLTIDIGLRYEILPSIWIADGVYGYPVGGTAGALGIQGPTGQPTTWAIAPNKGKDVFRTDKNNFAPSVGFSWDPFGDSKTAVRGSYRVAYDRFMMVAGDYSNSNYGSVTQVILTPFARFSDLPSILPIATPRAFEPLGFERSSEALAANPNLASPYVQSWSFGIQREVARNWTVSATYVGNHAVGMWRGPNLNQVEMRSNGFLDAFQKAQRNLANNGSLTVGESLGSLEPLFALIPSSQNTTVNQGQAARLADYLDTTTFMTGKRGGLLELVGLPVTFFRFNPQVQDLGIVGNAGHSTFNGLKLALNKRLDKGLYFQANYTLGKSLTDAVPGQNLRDDYRDNANYKLDKGLSPLDSTHVMQFNGIWELPLGRGKHFLSDATGFVQGLLGGWQLNGIFNYTTGRPLGFTTGRNMISQTVSSTPDYSGSAKNFGQVSRGDLITFLSDPQKSAFTNPGAGEPGGLPLYAFHGPGFSTLDMSLFKRFDLRVIREGTELQFRMEFFNLFNTVSFQSPDTNINSGSFGQLRGAYDGRIGQFALKIIF